jgi:tRNA 2-thiouridine synthesizing protein A
MTYVKKDFRGLKCPMPTLKLIPIMQTEVKQGDILEVMADCPTFHDDVKKFCQQWKKQLLKMDVQGAVSTATIKI